MGKVAFALLVAAVFAQIWFASTPLPLGGPNVIFAGLAVLAAAVCFVLPVLQARNGERGVVLVHRLGDLRPIGRALVVLGATIAWAVAVCAMHGAWDALLLGKVVLGMGVFCAVFLTMNTVRRASAFALAFAFAVAVSALYGVLFILVGEPFTTGWVWLTSASDEHLEMLFHSATSGLAVHPSTFGNQLAVAIPVALSAVLWSVAGACERLRTLRVAVASALLMLLTTLLLVNASRSSLVGAVAGVGATAWLWLRHRGQRRRTAIVLGFVASTLLGYSALWLALAGTDVFGRQSSKAGQIDGLVVGPEALRRDDALVGHRFDGYDPDVRYEVFLQEVYRLGRGPRTKAREVATADADGTFVLAWRRSTAPDIQGYMLRWRVLGERRLRPPPPTHAYFTPTLPTAVRWSVCPERPGEGDLRLAIRDLRATTPPLPINRLRMRLGPMLVANRDADELRAGVHLRGEGEHAVQVRACDADAVGTPVQVAVTPVPDRPVILTWRDPKTSTALEYRFRSRPLGETDWGPWRNVLPVRAGGPRVATLGVGGHALVDDPPSAGHVFRGLVHWQWFVVQIRTRRTTGFDPPMVIAARPDLRGRLVLVWAEPSDPASVVGYQFRLRFAAATEWLSWMDFQPTLSGRVPVPVLLPEAAIGDDVLRHTLGGLTPGFVYSVQMRARNKHGYGAESMEIVRPARSDGTLPILWRTTGGSAPATGYQYRLWYDGSWQWWQDLAQAGADGRTEVRKADEISEGADAQVAFLRTAHGLTGGLPRPQQKLSWDRWFDLSVRTRISQAPLVLRYALDHPLGTGVFAPATRHMADAKGAMVDGLPPDEPHNQFLHMLVLFGVPGLLLLVFFYALVVRAVARCASVAAQTSTPALCFLCACAAGMCVAYFVASLALPTGPLLHDWDHFLVLGLLFAAPRLPDA